MQGLVCRRRDDDAEDKIEIFTSGSLGIRLWKWLQDVQGMGQLYYCGYADVVIGEICGRVCWDHLR